MRCLFLFVFFLALGPFVGAQEPAVDSLQAVSVEAFLHRSKAKEQPVNVAHLSPQLLQRFLPFQFNAAFNSIAGVRMEERSPGSYRLNMRGSAIRSPFGVRNTKIYLNGIPVSDAGGNTYLNLLDPQLVQQVTLIKGPAASVYGAGTQGAVLLETHGAGSVTKESQVQASLGSFGLVQLGFRMATKTPQKEQLLQAQYLQQQGYRQQTALEKSQVFWQGGKRMARAAYAGFLLVTHLRYQTPGGLTAAQMAQDRRQARPASGSIPGAVAQQTGVDNKTVLSGLKGEWQLSPSLQLNGFLTLGKTRFNNPFLTNWEERAETPMGAGFQGRWQKETSNMKWSVVVGGEALWLESQIRQYENRGGQAGAEQSNDLVRASQRFLFAQLQVNGKKGWQIQLGSSSNLQGYDYKKMGAAQWNERRASAPLVPRLALQYRLGPSWLVYGVASAGFSPPSLAEFRPSDGLFYPRLEAERGKNLEAGLRWNSRGGNWQWGLAIYRFRLEQTIARRLDNLGQEFFVNAGATAQNGLEMQFEGIVWQNSKSFLKRWDTRGQFSWQAYSFLAYRNGANDFSGNPLTGVPAQMAHWANGWYFSQKWECHLGLQYTSRLPLNDAATVWDPAYVMAQLSVKKSLAWGHRTLSFQGTVDNLLGAQYSLGNDINAAGGRFYNPAAGTNFALLVRVSW